METKQQISRLMKNLHNLFLEGLQDMYYAEQQLVKALPKLAKVATYPELQSAIEAHLVETRGHVEMLENVFTLFDEEPKSRKCAAIVGIIKEAEDILSENKKSPTINAAIIFAAQKSEHYEIASYGTLREWAMLLGHTDAANILDDILDQEKAANRKLTGLAEAHCNVAAQPELAGRAD